MNPLAISQLHSLRPFSRVNKRPEKDDTYDLFSYVFRRILLALTVLFFVSIVSFSIIHLTPGDPVTMMVDPRMGPEVIEALRERLGLARPLHVQYLLFVRRIFEGDFGRSSIQGSSSPL